MAIRDSTKEERDIWVVNTGCNSLVTNNIKWYINFVEFTKSQQIGGHSSKPTLAYRTGTIVLLALRPGGRSKLELKDM